MLSHLRQPVTIHIPSPTEQKDRNDGKSSPTIFWQPLAEWWWFYHHLRVIMTNQKVVPPLKGGRTSDTIKEPLRKEEGKISDSEKRVVDWSPEQWLTKPSEGVSGHPVRTSFVGLAEAGTILSWKQASIGHPRGSLGREASTNHNVTNLSIVRTLIDRNYLENLIIIFKTKK